MQTPSADSRPEGSIAVTLNKNDIWKFGTLTASPFDWLEASYFYYRPSDLKWEGNSKRGHYLDKGFNVKFIYRPKNNNLPNIAIGLDDFAGTGLFTREYVVLTSIQSNIKYSLGIGWGKFAGNNSFKNPLSDLSSSLLSRPLVSDNYNLGGSLSYDQWFRGNASIFGGLEWRIANINGLNLKLEYDPFNYLDFSAQNRSDAFYEIRKKDSDLNIGLSYALNKHLTIDASYIKGNTFNISFNMGITFNDSLSTKPKFKPMLAKQDVIKKEKSIFYENLLYNLNNNSLFLQTSTLHKNGNLDLAISTADHRNAIRSSSYAAYISNKVADLNDIDLSLINVSHINAGIELNNITY
ncbi:YjbH domain-containing protein, partial [Gammaproteobacteria bacterium]|nr:YjbH domain-containing protein [Gammaproteobacteria bacterium]